MKVKALVAALSITMASVASAQIPVTDGASIAKQVAQHAETVLKWKAQYDQMTAQIDQMKSQYQALTGSRGLGMILDNPALREYLPSDWKGVYDSVKKGGYEGLTGLAKSIYESNKVYDTCAGMADTQQRSNCQAQAVKGAQDKAFATAAFDKAKSRLDQINGLMSKINDTSDTKAIAELQARIGAEQAMIQNEQTKLQMYQMVAAAEEKIQQQQQREIQSRTWSNRKSIEVQPLTFGSK